MSCAARTSFDPQVVRVLEGFLFILKGINFAFQDFPSLAIQGDRVRICKPPDPRFKFGIINACANGAQRGLRPPPPH